MQRINILGHAETPGLGDEIETESFKNQFIGKDMEHLKVVKTETTENIQAISGATISSRAVTEDAVRNGIDFLIKIRKNDPFRYCASHLGNGARIIIDTRRADIFISKR